MPWITTFVSLIEQKSSPTHWVCSQHKPKILFNDGSHLNLSSTLVSLIMRTYPDPSSVSLCTFWKAAWRLWQISIFDGKLAEGDSRVTADEWRRVNTPGSPRVWCARLATCAPPSHRKRRPQDISSSEKFFGLYKPFYAWSSNSIIPLTPTPWFKPLQFVDCIESWWPTMWISQGNV